MTFLKETSILLPEFDFCLSVDKMLNCLYILMSYINSQPLNDLWFGNRLNKHTPKQKQEYQIRR